MKYILVINEDATIAEFVKSIDEQYEAFKKEHKDELMYELRKMKNAIKLKQYRLRQAQPEVQ